MHRGAQLTHMKVHRPERTDAPAAWNLNNCTLMVDQSVWFVAAACSQKARSYTNQTQPANSQ